MKTEVRRDPGRVQVLLVEDSPSDAALIRVMLEQAATYDARHVDQIGGTLEALNGWSPDVILLDLGLPDAHGLSAVDKMKKLMAGTPIVVLTGMDDDMLALEALQRGAQDYISKNDMNPRLLHRVVRHAIERQRLIDQLEAARERVEKLSMSDPLTGLLNRRGFARELEKECKRALREQQPVCLLAWDLDNFKQVNDSLGHAAGDEILEAMAARARGVLRETDVIARMGGDEFMALLPATSRGGAHHIADRLREGLSERPFELAASSLHLTASVGLVEVNPEQVDLQVLLADVDRELYRSKRAGKNRVSSGPVEDRAPAPGPEGDEPVALFHTARRILRASDNALVAHDLVLLTAENESPGSEPYLAASGDTGALTRADVEILDRSIAAALELPPGLPCHVHVLPSTLQQVGSAGVLEILAGVEDRELRIVLSSPRVVGDPAHLVPPVEGLKRAGYAIGLDDVGAGRTCLENLLLLEPSSVGVGHRWTRDLARRPDLLRESRRLIRILATLGCTVIVARPASAEDCSAVREMGAEAGIELLWSESGRTLGLPLKRQPSLRAATAARTGTVRR